VLGAVFLFNAFQVFRLREGSRADRAARRLFSFSILYLFSLFATVFAEHLAGLTGAGN
jgi:protoheme IX farnesyltransferase